MPTTATDILEANLRALAEHSPDVARLVREAEPKALTFIPTDDGVDSAELAGPSGSQALASRRRPLAEAEALAQNLDLSKAAVLVVGGFGVGHHVRAIAKRLDRSGIALVFEPDVALLRAVLERIDMSAWLGSTNIRVLVDASDRGAMSEALRGCEGLVGLGVSLVEHAPSRPRLASAARAFFETLVQVVEGVKMNVLTSLVQVRTTMRNTTQNLAVYARSAGVRDLAGCCAGRPGVVVAAGPSFARNIDQLADPALRERLVIVAVQTVLKPMLARGVRPHLVCALDHSEISRRFYEGLTREDVRGITLVVQPMVNPAVLDAWPGEVRTTADHTLDRLLGESHVADKGELPLGATVAHLAYYLARHLGCDPVALLGQDLGFTDGQYYAAGAAIHNVWACELNDFNTLEMMEWQRIVRMGSHLRRAQDHLGRSIFTDEQMIAYLAQFERDFKADAARALSIIDCTEGGVHKQHTRAMPLARFLQEHARAGAPPVRLPEPVCPRPVGRARLEERLLEVGAQTRRIGALSRDAQGVLSQIIEHQADQPRVNAAIGRLERLTTEVTRLNPAYQLVHTLSQKGSFKRIRADRLIHVDHALDELAVQRRQAQRDLDNVATLAECADELATMLDAARAGLSGGPRLTREPPRLADLSGESARPAHTGLAAHLLVLADDARPPAALRPAPALGGRTPLQLTLERLHACDRVDALVIATDAPEMVRAAVASSPFAGRTRVHPLVADGALRHRRELVRIARLPARSCWRGGVGGTTAFDEAFDPLAAARALAASPQDPGSSDGVLILGPEWIALDPALTRQVVDRYLEDPQGLRMTFSQASPGLAPCVLSRALIAQLAAAVERGAALQACIGALLGYVPAAPVNDLIASTRCVHVPTIARDAATRFIADHPADIARIADVLAYSDDASRLCQAASERPRPHAALTIVTPHLAGPGPRTAPCDDLALCAMDDIERHIGALDPPGLLTLGSGADEPLRWAHLERVVRQAQANRLGVHVRTPLAGVSTADIDRLAALSPDLVSVDLFADSPETYAALTGRSDFELVRAQVERLLGLRRSLVNAGGPLIVVPRMTRCDGAYADVETFYHRWLHFAGCVVIDPLPVRAPVQSSQRIVPLPVPASAAPRFAAARCIRAAAEDAEAPR